MNINVSIKKLKAGDESELKRFYQLYFPHFLSYALGFIKSEDVCNDLVQEVYIAYWDKHKHFDDIISLKVYFYRAIRNKCLNEIRTQKSVEQISLDEIHHIASTDYMEEHVIREEIALLVRQHIAKLTPQAQRILNLSLCGRNNQEIAEELSLSVNTVKTHKLKAYSQLRLELESLHALLLLLTVL